LILITEISISYNYYLFLIDKKSNFLSQCINKLQSSFMKNPKILCFILNKATC
jgi:hypothetical protein